MYVCSETNELKLDENDGRPIYDGRVFPFSSSLQINNRKAETKPSFILSIPMNREYSLFLASVMNRHLSKTMDIG